MGALNKAERNLRPRYNEIDWRQTIRLNLKHYQPAYQTIIPERLIGYARKRSTSLPQRTIILCIDQSGSMASSVVYTGIFGAVLASLRAVKTHVVAFDTAVVDLTEHLDDPVELLFWHPAGRRDGYPPRPDLLPGAGPAAAGYDPRVDQRPV